MPIMNTLISKVSVIFQVDTTNWKPFVYLGHYYSSVGTQESKQKAKKCYLVSFYFLLILKLGSNLTRHKGFCYDLWVTYILYIEGKKESKGFVLHFLIIDKIFFIFRKVLLWIHMMLKQDKAWVTSTGKPDNSRSGFIFFLFLCFLFRLE